MGRGLVPFPSENAKLEYQEGADWIRVPGVGSYRETGGEAPTRDVVGFEATSTLTGRRRVPTIECDVASYLPHHAAWKKIRAQSDAQKSLTWRLVIPEDTVFTGDGTATAAIAAATGIVTFAAAGGSLPTFTNPEYAPGLGLVVAGTLYVIDDVDATTGVFTVRKPPNDVAASAAWSIIRPALRRGPFAAKVANTDRSQLGSESNLLSVLRLQPAAELPEWEALASAA